MKILSLFDGISCGYIAFKELNIFIDEYYAYEIDKYAIKTSTYNFPYIKQCGDVFNANFKQYKDIDFLIGGSPCTYWSIAQTTNKRETTNNGIGWKLFQQFVKALNEIKPKYFIYENNKSISKEIQKSITNEFGIDSSLINSSIVSPQNRNRLYWVGIRNKYNKYDKVNIDITKCIDNTYVCDILDTKFNVNDTNRYNKPIKIGNLPNINGNINNSQSSRIYSIFGKSVVLNAHGGGKGAKVGLYAIPINDIDDSMIKSKYIIKVHNKKYELNNKIYNLDVSDGLYVIRTLTSNECRKLQTIPSYFKFPVSDNKIITLLGNGWNINTIKLIISNCINIDK